ncbi:MAG: porin family protein [Bacteroidaceae bacterium]
MNKALFYIIPIISCCYCTTVKAQVGEARNNLALGINAGVTMNTISFDPTIKQKSLTAPTFGLTFRYTCEKYFRTLCSVQLELNYANLGWEENVMNSANEPLPDTYRRNISYLQLPLLARMSWGKEQKGLMFYIIAGPQIGYSIGENSKTSNTITTNPAGNPDRPNNVYQQYTMDIKNKLDYGIQAGAGLELNTAIGHFMVDGRYYYGLSDVFGNSKKDVFSRSANGTIMVKMTYLFDLKK